MSLAKFRKVSKNNWSNLDQKEKEKQDQQDSSQEQELPPKEED